jgi:hypothetical protein
MIVSSDADALDAAGKAGDVVGGAAAGVGSMGGGAK